jgi:hypothetical protein
MFSLPCKALLAAVLAACLLAACGGESAPLSSPSVVPPSAGPVTTAPDPAPAVLLPHAETFRQLTYPGGSLVDFASGNHIHVALAQDGVATSMDGTVWTLTPTFTKESLRRVLFTGERFAVLSDTGSLFTSTDGNDWIPIASGLPYLADVIHTGTRYIGRLDGGITTSEDGVIWTQRVQSEELNIRSVAPVSIGRVNGKYVIFTSDALFVSPDGLTWSRTEKPVTAGKKIPMAISYGNGVYVLLVSYPALTGEFYTGIPAGSEIYTSTDGNQWTQRYASDSEVLMHISFVHGTFIATGPTGALRTSTDGVNWTHRVSGAAGFPGTAYRGRERAFYFNEQFFIPTESGGFITSKDAANWSSGADAGAKQTVLSVTEAKDRLFILALERLGVSSDGVSWKFIEPTGFYPSDVIYANGLFVAVGGGLELGYSDPAPGDRLPKGAIHTSPDGVRWTLRAKGNDLSLHSVTYGDGRFVAVGGRSVGDPSSSTVMVSENGIDWTRVAAPVKTMLEQVIYGDGEFMAVGTDLVTAGTDPIRKYSGTLIGSPDGKNWTVRLPPFSGQAHGIAYGSGRYLLSASLQDKSDSYQNVFYASTDGRAWAMTASPYNGFAGIAYSNGVFLSGGGTDLITSKDGQQWTRHPAGDMFLNHVDAKAGNLLAFFATDISRAYMTSTDGEIWKPQALHQFGFGGMSRAVYGNSTWLMTPGIYISP